jgi:hypothetical protein
MTSLLIPQMLRGSFEPLRDAMPNKDHPPTADHRRDIVAAFPLVKAMLEKLRSYLDALGEHGIESRKLALVAKEVQSALDLGRQVLGELRGAWLAAPEDQGKQHDLAQLEAFQHFVDKIRADNRTLLTWLDTSPPKVDLAVLDAAQEGSESLDSILARLHAGGDL